MIAEDATVLDYLPGSPAVTERQIIMTHDAAIVLKRMLRRFGLPPQMVGFKAVGTPEEPQTHVVGRAPSGDVVPFARIFCGPSLDALEAARRALLDAAWEPKPPHFETMLPDGRIV